MSEPEKCVICGAVIPEGKQVCPACEKENDMGSKTSSYFNHEDYADPTAYAALKAVEKEENAALDNEVWSLVKVLKYIIDRAGFDLMNRIELRDRKTGREYK